MRTDMERPKLREIPGTDLAYILVQCGRDENGFDGRARTIRERALKWDEPSRESIDDQRILNNYCYKIYIRDGRPLDELAEALSSKNNDGHLPRPHMVGDMFFSPVNQDLTPDSNGNLLLKSHGSQLENIKVEGGDVLIDTKGNVLRNTKGHEFIYALEQKDMEEGDVQFGYYKTAVFNAKNDYVRNTTDIIGIEYNFLTPDGKLISRTPFERTDRPTMVTVDRTFRYEKGKTLFIDKDVYPAGYVYTDQGDIRFFPSPAALLIANRTRIGENPNLKPFITDETPIIGDYYERQGKIKEVLSNLTAKCSKGFKSEKGGISYETYRAAINAMKEEDELIHIFEKNFETKNDLAIQSALEQDMEYEG